MLNQTFKTQSYLLLIIQPLLYLIILIIQLTVHNLVSKPSHPSPWHKGLIIMARNREKFEKELVLKLQQKSTAHISEETILMRSFKYFDLDNSGFVSFEEWVRAIEKIGVVLPDGINLREIFIAYDSDASGELDYREFIAGVFGENSNAGKFLAPQKASSPAIQQQGLQALEKLRDRLLSRGARGIIGLAKQFHIMDDNDSKTIDFQEFSKVIKDFRVDLNEQEKQAVFNLIDRNRSGEIDYDELLRAVRGPMNGFRKALVAKAFDKLDADGSGIIDINDIRRLYNAKAHPNVRTGRVTEDEVLGEFLETFETHHNICGGNDRRVTREEFEEYYNNVSASIDNDSYFELMMNNTWKLTEAPAYTRNKAWASAEDRPPSRAPPSSAPRPSVRNSGSSFEVFREKLASRGTRGIIGIQRQFKIMDDDGSKTLSFAEFKKGCRDFRVDVSEQDLQEIFRALDRDRSGFIDYDELIRGLKGPLNSFRRSLVQQAWRKLDRDHSGVVDIEDLRGVYNASNHPDVRSGKKTEDEVLGEFLETFETHHNICGGNDRRVTREEFEEYYNNVSASIDNDSYFELMMNNTWKLTEAPAYTRNKAWASAEDRPPSRAPPSSAPRPSVRNSGSSFEVFREKLASRGTRGIIGIQRQFKIMDDDGSKTLSFAEFKKGCRDFRVDVSEQDLQEIFRALDRDRSGFIDYDELIRGLKGPLNSFRRSLVQQAWRKLDRDHSGVVDIEDLRGVYNASNHPDVRSGKKTEDEVLGEFLETFETHHNICDLARRDRRVTPEEFEEYYANVSASVDDDKYFELMMQNAWRLSGEATKQEPWAGQFSTRNFTSNSKSTYIAINHPSVLGGTVNSTAPFGTSNEPVDYSTHLRPNSKPVPAPDKAAGRNTWTVDQDRPTSGSARNINELLDNLRAKLASRGARGFVGLARQFKIMDDNNNKTLEFHEFSKALKDFRVDLPEDSVRRLFAYFDADRNGVIDYEEFSHRLRGQLNEFRLSLVRAAFSRLDKNGNGIVELDDVKGVYNASNHPDVRSGKKTEDEVLCEFLDTFETHHAIFKENTRDFRVSFEEFAEYYSHISASIDEDKYFELMMKNAWNFENKTYQKAWAGDNLTSARRQR